MVPVTRDNFTRHEITAELRAHGDLIYQFANAWYRSPYTFRCVRWLGHLVCKIPFDLHIYHDLFCQYRFQTVIETGTAHGGSAFYYATLMDLLQIDGGKVITIDINDGDPSEPRPEHPRITYIKGSSLDADIVGFAHDVIAAQTAAGRPNVLVNLDSDHCAPHVLRELALYAPLVPVNGWLVVEDTNGAPVVQDPATGKSVAVEGPFAAVMEYLASHPGEFLRDVVCERLWLTMNPHGWLQRMEACTHE
jgi:cephalosporin hydroxylase